MTTANERRLSEACKQQKQQIETQAAIITHIRRKLHRANIALQAYEEKFGAMVVKGGKKATQQAKFKR